MIKTLTIKEKKFLLAYTSSKLQKLKIFYLGLSKTPNAYNCCEFFDNARQKRRVYRVINTSFLTQQYQKRCSKNMR
jgi:hypothetical protein